MGLSVLNELNIRGDLREVELVNTAFPPREARVVLGGSFSNVVERGLAAPVLVPDPGLVLRHAASTAAAHSSKLHDPEVMDRMLARVASVIARDGVFRTTSDTALCLAC